ncbi:MAG: DUF262 domain-containing protein [Nitrospirae bacterium]|nr:DUF262 domain-containing protein [Nitrospirota bacterium]
MKRNIIWFINLYHDGQLDLKPPYQRRSVWTLKDRKFFLDTIFRNYPCPAVFLHKEIDRSSEKMIYRVVDGKQRLETIILFFENDIAIDKSYIDVRLAGKKWINIEKEPELRDYFLNYALTVEFLDTHDNLVINEVFDRLNRNSRKLERQELRHAKFDGWFIKMAEKEAEKQVWEHLGVVTKAKMRRMKDVQCISELLIVLLKNGIIGYDQDVIDDIYAEYDSPNETSPDFDEYEFKKRLELTKDYILKMENHNYAVTKNVSGFSHFYSLWTFVALNIDNLDTPEITAGRYSEFMGKVTALSRIRDIKLLREYENGLYSKDYIYIRNSVQSSTGKPQREARNEILKSVLLSYPPEEGTILNHEKKSTFSLPNGLAVRKNDKGEYILKLIMGKSDSTEEGD